MFVIKNKNINRYMQFDRFAQDMYIRVDPIPVGSIEAATTMEDQSEVDYILQMLDNQGEDISIYEVCDYDSEIKAIHDREDQEALAAMGNAWSNTSEDKKKEMLDAILQQKGPDAVAKFLQDVMNGQSLQQAQQNAVTSNNSNCSCGSTCNCNSNNNGNSILKIQDLINAYTKYKGYAIKVHCEEPEEVNNDVMITKVLADDDSNGILYLTHPSNLTDYVDLDDKDVIFDAGALIYFAMIPEDENFIDQAIMQMPFDLYHVKAENNNIPLQGNLLNEFNKDLENFVDYE